MTTALKGFKRETTAMLSNKFRRILRLKANRIPKRILVPRLSSLIFPKTKEAARRIKRTVEKG
jgi:hypothetical protein